MVERVSSLIVGATHPLAATVNPLPAPASLTVRRLSIQFDTYNDDLIDKDATFSYVSSLFIDNYVSISNAGLWTERLTVHDYQGLKIKF